VSMQVLSVNLRCVSHVRLCCTIALTGAPGAAFPSDRQGLGESSDQLPFGSAGSVQQRVDPVRLGRVNAN
jgi:hypothetical protein